MRTRHFQLLATTAALALALPAIAAAADTSDSTTVTFEVTGASGLSIDVEDGPASLTETDGVAVGELPDTTITDARGGLTNLTWNVNVSGTDFVQTKEGEEVARIDASAGRAYLDIADVSNLAQLRGMEPLLFAAEIGGEDLGTPYSLLSGTSLLGILGTGYLTYTPSVRVEIPEGQLGGTYSGSVTQTVSASG